MSESIEWLRTGARVYSKGQGMSYNCNNIATAKTLHQTLTTYETTLQTNNNTNNKLDEIEKQVIALQMDLSNVQDTVNKIKDVLQDEKDNNRQ